MADTLMRKEATADGATNYITLPPGVFTAQISADTWDGASATLQEGSAGDFVDCDDPYNTGNALTRTANGKLITIQGGLSYRLNVSSYGASTSGLALVIRESSR